MFNILITSDPRYIINKDRIKQAVTDILEAQRLKGEIEVEVNIVGDRKMQELNKTYRGIDQTTNILTFPLEQMSLGGFVAAPDKILRLGSIVISLPQAVLDAVRDNKTLDNELIFLSEHGTRHLLGIHHD